MLMLLAHACAWNSEFAAVHVLLPQMRALLLRHHHLAWLESGLGYLDADKRTQTREHQEEKPSIYTASQTVLMRERQASANQCLSRPPAHAVGRSARD